MTDSNVWELTTLMFTLLVGSVVAFFAIDREVGWYLLALLFWTSLSLFSAAVIVVFENKNNE